MPMSRVLCAPTWTLYNACQEKFAELDHWYFFSTFAKSVAGWKRLDSPFPGRFVTEAPISALLKINVTSVQESRPHELPDGDREYESLT